MRANCPCWALVLALACGGDKPGPEPPAPAPPGLTAAEAGRLPGCIDALEQAGTAAGGARVAVACSPECDLDIPEALSADDNELVAFVIGRCAREAPPGQSLWHLAELAGAWIAGVYERAPNSHPELAARLETAFELAEIPLLIEARAEGLFHLPPAARVAAPQTEVYVVVTGEALHAGIAGWADFSARGARRKIGFGGPFPGTRVRPSRVRELATRMHATVSSRENPTAEDRAPLVLADRALPVARLRRVIKRLGRARLGVDRRGLAAEHQTHLSWVDRWSGTWLLFRPSRTLVRTADGTITVAHRDGAIDWPGVRAALARAGGGDLALDPPDRMTVRELTVVLDQIKTPDSDPSLFFTRSPDLEPAVTVTSIAVAKDRLAATSIRRALGKRTPALIACYEPVLARDDRAEGTATVELAVSRTGAVTAVEADSTLGDSHRACVAGVVSALRFRRPRGRQPTAVKTVLSFTAD